jgi:hypothetical protein
MTRNGHAQPWAALLAFLRSPIEAIRARRKAAEDAEDAWLAEIARERLENPEGPNIPWEQVKREAGLK